MSEGQRVDRFYEKRDYKGTGENLTKHLRDFSKTYGALWCDACRIFTHNAEAHRHEDPLY